MNAPGLQVAADAPAERAPSRLSAFLDRLLHLHDSPARTAAAFSVGVFFSFSPFIGFQILLSMAIAILFRLNRVAVFVGLNANLPWFLVPWYGGTTLAAAWVLGLSSPVAIRQQVEGLFTRGVSPASFLERAGGLLSTALVPLLVGATTGALVVALLTYPIVRRVLARRAARAVRPSPPA